MPAINPEILSQRIEDVLKLLDEPRRFARACYEMLEFYADRTKRTSTVAGRIETARVLRVSRPVLRMLCNEILHYEHADTADWLEAADLMWTTGVREGRFVAACLLSRAAPEDVPKVAESWAESCEDAIALEKLASEGLSTWREEDTDVFLQVLKRWMDDPRLQVRHLALLLIANVSRDSTYDKHLPETFQILQGVSEKVRGESRQSLIALMRQMARHSPAETTKFLLDERKVGYPGVKRLIRSTMDALPENYSDALNFNS
jgi:hypothetical protein